MKKQLFESILEEASDRFLVIDGGLDGYDDFYYFYLAEDGTMKEFNDGEPPCDPKLNPSIQEIYDAVIKLFGSNIVGGKASAKRRAETAYNKGKHYVTIRIPDDFDELTYQYKDIELLPVDNPNLR